MSNIDYRKVVKNSIIMECVVYGLKACDIGFMFVIYGMVNTHRLKTMFIYNNNDQHPLVERVQMEPGLSKRQNIT